MVLLLVVTSMPVIVEFQRTTVEDQTLSITEKPSKSKVSTVEKVFFTYELKLN